MNLSGLLSASGIAPGQVVVVRHRPYERALDKVLPWLVAERSELFEAYQQTHGPKLEGALQRAQYLASFIRHGPGRALFVGLNRIGDATPLTLEGFWSDPRNIELRRYGYVGFTEKEGREHILSFDLEPTAFYPEWRGRLVVSWPGLERSWWRWADRNTFPILAISEEDQFAGKMPSWDALVLDWQELGALPASWRATLAQWRGIYLIHDTSDGRAYVGSAYGEDNILGRWMQYAATGHGDNRLLRQRDPKSFRFSILQLMSPTTEPHEVIRVETSWKERLHTRSPSGLNGN